MCVNAPRTDLCGGAPGKPASLPRLGSNGETVLRLKAEQAFGVGVWTFRPSMSATLTHGF